MSRKGNEAARCSHQAGRVSLAVCAVEHKAEPTFEVKPNYLYNKRIIRKQIIVSHCYVLTNKLLT